MSEKITFELVQNYVELISYIENINSTGRRSIDGVIDSHNCKRVKELICFFKKNGYLEGQVFPDFDEDDGDISINFPSFYYISLSILLKEKPEFRVKLPSQIIYFQNENIIFDPNQLEIVKSNQIITQYIDCITIYDLLKSKADHVSQTILNEESLFFLGKKRLEIFNDLEINNSIKITKLSTFKANFCDTNIHNDAIKQIVSDGLCSYFSNKSKISINDIIRNFDNIFDVINNNYNMYLSEFTFEKIKKEIEKFRTESITRINKTFSDIQMQIIAVPASLIVVASNLKTGKDFSIIVNSIVLLGAIFFAVAVLFMCSNQKDTLKNIKHEIDTQKDVFTKDPLFENNNEILINFEALSSRYKKQNKNIFIIQVGVVISILIMFFIYIYYLVDNTCLSITIPCINFLSRFYC